VRVVTDLPHRVREIENMPDEWAAKLEEAGYDDLDSVINASIEDLTAIEAATASMSKAPLTRCFSALGSFSSLEGLSIERGIIKELHSRLGGPKGCTHLMELLNDVIRFTSMLLLGQSMGYQPKLKEILTEEEIIAEGMKKLRNTCFVFADE